MDTGDTAWLMVSAAFVMLMVPGLALFYGGLARSKNVLATIMQSFFMLGVITILFVTVGYSLAFGPDHGGLIGDFSWAFMNDVSASEPGPYAPTVSHQTFMIFQCMFAVITPALITGAFAERAKFSTFLIFMVLWSLIVYSPVAHWVWALGGWLGPFAEENGDVGIGALDFAGGTVVHINAGAAALVAAILYGKRHNFGREPMEAHDITMVVVGAGLLWFGWFGFNAGSALGASSIATNAFVVTHIAAATAMVVWVGLSWMVQGKPSVIGAAAGAVAGLVAITPAAGAVDAMGAIAVGGGAGAICYLAVRLRTKIGIDDSLDVVGVHGVGGAWGAIATGLFATATITGGPEGLLQGDSGQFVDQLIGVGVTMAYSLVVTYGLLKVLDVLFGLRVSEEAEIAGLDVSEHGERAYIFDGGGAPYSGIPITPEVIPTASAATTIRSEAGSGS